jgi:hypothetical protein
MCELVCFPFWFGLSLEVAPANFFSWLRHRRLVSTQTANVTNILNQSNDVHIKTDGVPPDIVSSVILVARLSAFLRWLFSEFLCAFCSFVKLAYLSLTF